MIVFAFLAASALSSTTADVPPAPPVHVAVVAAPAGSYNGKPLAPAKGQPLSELVGKPTLSDLAPVTLTGPDGFTVTVDADRAGDYAKPRPANLDDQLFAELCQIRPWASNNCPAS